MEAMMLITEVETKSGKELQIIKTQDMIFEIWQMITISGSYLIGHTVGNIPAELGIHFWDKENMLRIWPVQTPDYAFLM